jgi:MOSC domain-containing protein YiiM
MNDFEPVPRGVPRVVAVSISAGGIPKLPQDSAWAAHDGLVGDGRNHAKHIRPDRAVSLFDLEILEQLVAEGFPLTPGAAGENLTVADLHVQHMAPGTLLQIGDVLLKLEQPRKPCYVLDAIDPRLKDAIVGRCGYLASVVREGIIAPGMEIVVECGPLAPQVAICAPA